MKLTVYKVRIKKIFVNFINLVIFSVRYSASEPSRSFRLKNNSSTLPKDGFKHILVCSKAEHYSKLACPNTYNNQIMVA